MKRAMNLLTGIFVISFLVFICIYCNTGKMLALTITLGTCAYHFLMRLCVGYVINFCYHNKMSYQRKWFQSKQWESKLYKYLKVKIWKEKMPTYAVGTFSFELYSMEEVLGAMCQAEVVHEIIVILSFVPLLFAISFGAFGVFLITSILAAGFDMMFVVMQRYNRPRIEKLLDKKGKRYGNI